jgi:NADH dehydrogenase FAD-containing subunit
VSNSKLGRERVVILGSGWGGYTLARRLDSKKFQTVIVSPRSYFVFTPLLASTSVGTLEFRLALEPVRSKRTSAQFFQGWADQVDFASRRIFVEESVDDPNQLATPSQHVPNQPQLKDVKTENKVEKGRIFDLQYDKLVIAVGCYSQTFGTPGVKEHALFLKDVGDARKIRNRLLTCFEMAALPTTSNEMRKCLLNFAIVGGGPTGIEFSAELNDLIAQDMSKIYPELIEFVNITVYDVAPKVLSMFDAKLSEYAAETLARDNVKILTSHHVERVRPGLPSNLSQKLDPEEAEIVCTLKTAEQGEVGVGMVVWSTGLQMNPFVSESLGRTDFKLPPSNVRTAKNTDALDHWTVKKDSKTGAIITNERLQIILEASNGAKGNTATLKEVYALGDCGSIQGTGFPATAQVAAQKAEWLGKHLNKGDADKSLFQWNNMGIMAYIGNSKAVLQGKGANVSGRLAWMVWRGAYLTKTVSFRNKLLIPMFWMLNWLFGRDTSRKSTPLQLIILTIIGF